MVIEVLLGVRHQKIPKWHKNKSFGEFDKGLVHSYVLFKLEYKIASGPLTFYKNCVPGKNQVLELWAKNL